MRALTIRGWGTLAAIFVLLAVGVAALLAAPTAPRPGFGLAPADPSSQALERCRDLGPAAESDAGCHATWRAARERFFGGEGRP